MAKYIMSEKEDYLEIDLDEVIELLATKKLKYNNEMKYPLGMSSPLLNLPIISLYDDSLLMEKYPNGVVTENFVLIPFDKFKEIKENATTILNHKTYDNKNVLKIDSNNFKPFLNEFMLAFVEMSLNIEVTNDEKLQIKKDLNITFTEEDDRLIKAGFETKDYKISHRNVTTPEKVTNRELLKMIEGKGYSFESKLRHAPDLSMEVKEVLKENESYIENITSIKEKIKEVNLKEVEANVTVEEFNNIVEKALNHLVSPVLPLKIVNQKIKQVLEQTEPSIKKFIEESEKQVFPYLSKLPPLQFKSSIELIFKEAFGGMDNYSKRFPHIKMDETKNDFALALVKDLDSLQREYLITVITGYDSLSKDIVTTDNPESTTAYKMK